MREFVARSVDTTVYPHTWLKVWAERDTYRNAENYLIDEPTGRVFARVLVPVPIWAVRLFVTWGKRWLSLRGRR